MGLSLKEKCLELNEASRLTLSCQLKVLFWYKQRCLPPLDWVEFAAFALRKSLFFSLICTFTLAEAIHFFVKFMATWLVHKFLQQFTNLIDFSPTRSHSQTQIKRWRVFQSVWYLLINIFELNGLFSHLAYICEREKKWNSTGMSNHLIIIININMAESHRFEYKQITWKIVQ